MENVRRLRLLSTLIVFNVLYHIVAVRFQINYLTVLFISILICNKKERKLGGKYYLCRVGMRISSDF